MGASEGDKPVRRQIVTSARTTESLVYVSSVAESTDYIPVVSLGIAEFLRNPSLFKPLRMTGYNDQSFGQHWISSHLTLECCVLDGAGNHCIEKAYFRCSHSAGLLARMTTSSWTENTVYVISIPIRFASHWTALGPT